MTMRIRAACHACGRDFLFFQLYNADPWHNDRCPHCNGRLRASGLRNAALGADASAAGLVNAHETIAEQGPAFTVDAESVLARIEDVLDVLSDPATDRHDHDDLAPPPVRRWWKRQVA